MGLFLASLGVIFVAAAIGLFVVRVQLERQDLWPTDLPRLPWALAAGTLVLVASAVSMQRGLRLAGDAGGGAGAGTGRRAPLARALMTTAALGALFLLVQAASWLTWFGAVRDEWQASNEWRVALTGFFVLSGLHALHVIGGLGALIHTWRLVAADAVIGDRVRYCAMYWHFLGAVWLVLYALLLVWS